MEENYIQGRESRDQFGLLCYIYKHSFFPWGHISLSQESAEKQKLKLLLDSSSSSEFVWGFLWYFLQLSSYPWLLFFLLLSTAISIQQYSPPAFSWHYTRPPSRPPCSPSTHSPCYIILFICSSGGGRQHPAVSIAGVAGYIEVTHYITLQ